MQRIAVDFETYLIDGANRFPKPVCLSTTVSGQELLVGHQTMETFLSQLLEKDIMIAHNAVFECGVIHTWMPNLRPALLKALKEHRVVCTQINEQLLDHTRRRPVQKYSLAALVLNHFKEDISESKKNPNAWRLRYHELDGVPLHEWPEDAKSYAIEDSIWAKKLDNIQIVQPDRYGPVVQAAVLLNLMAATGMRVDVNRVEQLEQEIYTKLSPIYAELIKEGYCVAVPGKGLPKKNMNKLRQHIADNIPEPELTLKGNVSTTSETLSKYANDPVISKFIGIAEYEKVLTAFTANLKHEYTYTQYSAAKSTGRTSSSKSKFYPSVNIQQMPRQVPNVTWDVRNCFIPREGYKYVAIDYAGLELAATAHQLGTYYGYSSMRDTINSGDKPVDMHSKLACRIMSNDKKLNISYEEFLTKKKEPEYAHYRQLSKPVNLGFPGGLGYDTMRTLLAQDNIRPNYKVILKEDTWDCQRGLHAIVRDFPGENLRVHRTSKTEYCLVYDELVGFKRELFGLYPELKEFLGESHKSFLTGQSTWTKNDFGEWEEEPMYAYNIYGFKRNWCTYTAFCNGFLMQTPAAIGAKKAMCKIIEKYLDDDRMNPLAFIHDEIVFEVKDNKEKFMIIDDVANILMEEMQSILSTVRITVEAQLMDYWDKKGGYWEKQYSRRAPCRT